MAPLIIESSLSGFALLRQIDRASEAEIAGQASFNQAPAYAGLEAMAQLAALDVRRRIDFAAHAFLLKIIHCCWPARRWLNGDFSVQARPGSQSRRAVVYHTSAQGPAGITLEAELMIGTTAYDHHFQQRQLKDYYRNRFICLQNDSNAS